ncbi:replication initiator protein [Capybara microvirus Cap3_SP_446]|nr:replication initiator protein [Capybara microvirus Cap3_SP_446]
MSCIKPYLTYRKNGSRVFAPCGECALCRKKKALEYVFLSSCECFDRYKKGQSVTFSTLTYTDYAVPLTAEGKITARRKDFQDYMKRFRIMRQRDGLENDFKLIWSSEYGDKFGRSHFHCIYYGLNVNEVDHYSWKAWNNDKLHPRGMIDISSLENAGAYYLTEYCANTPTRAAMKVLYDDNGLERPCCRRSINLGSDTLKSLVDDSIASGEDFTTDFFGRETPFPSYIRRKYDPDCKLFNYKKWYKKHIENLKTIHQTDEQFTWIQNHLAVAQARMNDSPCYDNSDSRSVLPPTPPIDIDGLALDCIDPIPF